MVFCSAVPPVSTPCLLGLLKVLCDPGVGFVCSECLAISWKTQQISAFPPSLRGWDPQPWLLGATSLEQGGWEQQGLRHLLTVIASAGMEGLGTALSFLGCTALLRARFMAALELPTLQPWQAPGKPPPQPWKSPKFFCFPGALWLACHLLREETWATQELFIWLWETCRPKLFSLPTAHLKLSIVFSYNSQLSVCLVFL